jgi:predicted transcriptional regulator
MKTPCEIIVWSVVPVIKREFAKMLVNEHGLNQREAAEKLDTTEAAISRYISGQRGALEIGDPEILQEIQQSSKKISMQNGSTTRKEICNICKLIRSKNIVEGIGETC